MKVTTVFKRALKGFCFVTFWFVFILFITQDIQIFPVTVMRLLGSDGLPNQLPANIEKIPHTSIDGTEIEVWRMAALSPMPGREKLRALILHGNGGTLYNFRFMQNWMAQLGIANYSFDYRGTGGSAGWPSEAGIHLDTLSVFSRMLREEQVDASDTIIIGISIGSGFAAALAAEVGPRALILFSPYDSLPNVARESILTRYLTPLMRYEVATYSFIKNIGAACLLVAHGVDDTIIPISHSDRLSDEWGSEGFRWYKRFENTGHNDLFFSSSEEVGLALGECLETSVVDFAPSEGQEELDAAVGIPQGSLVIEPRVAEPQSSESQSIESNSTASAFTEPK